jgi:hypothetical protein
VKTLLIIVVACLALFPVGRWLMANLQAVSAGAETDTATHSPANAGQAAIGRTTDGHIYLHAGILACIAPTMCVQVPPDLDHDCDVDDADLVLFKACSLGGGIAHPPGATCTQADFDADGDVDAGDYGRFQRCHGPSNVQPFAHCAD